MKRIAMTVSIDLRDSTDRPTAHVSGHRSANGLAHVRLTLGENVDVLLDVQQAEVAMMRLAGAVALAKQPKHTKRAKREEAAL